MANETNQRIETFSIRGPRHDVVDHAPRIGRDEIQRNSSVGELDRRQTERRERVRGPKAHTHVHRGTAGRYDERLRHRPDGDRLAVAPGLKSNDDVDRAVGEDAMGRPGFTGC
jgi:hypothetical protein